MSMEIAVDVLRCILEYLGWDQNEIEVRKYAYLHVLESYLVSDLLLSFQWEFPL